MIDIPRIVFMYGPPASGKLTIGRELAAATRLPLFHNHLTVDLLLEVFPFGSPQFVALRERIWMGVLTEAIKAGRSVIFTFNPESTVSKAFIPTLRKEVEEAGGQIDFVEVQCPEAEIERRLASPSRTDFKKLQSLELYRELRRDGAFKFPGLPEPRASVDTSKKSPIESAQTILMQLGFAPGA